MSTQTKTAIPKEQVRTEYTWPAASAIEKLSFVREPSGLYRAYIYSQVDAQPAQLSAAPALLRREGFDAYPDIHEGRQCLVVTHLDADADKKLTALLQSSSSVLGEPSVLSQKKLADRGSIAADIARDSMKWTGRLSILGSAAIAAVGLAQKDPDRVAAGVLFGLAELPIILYGNGKGEMNFDKMFHNMHTYFAANGIDLPIIAEPEKRRDAVTLVRDFIKNHPMEITYGIGTLGSISTLKSGLADFGRSKAGISRTAKGAVGTVSHAAVAFLPEAKHAPLSDASPAAKTSKEHDARFYLAHPVEAVKTAFQFVFYSPVRFKGLVGTFYSTLYLTDALEESRKLKLWKTQKGGTYEGKTYGELKTALSELEPLSGNMSKPARTALNATQKILQKGVLELERRSSIANTFWGGKVSPYLAAVTGVSFILASLLAASSSKNRHASFSQGVAYEPVYALAAQSLLHFQPSERKDILKQMATYLSVQEDIKDGNIGREKIMREVEQRLAKLENSPWLKMPEINKHRAAERSF